MPAQTSRAELRAVLEKRVADWKARLLSEFRDKTRFVLDQLLHSRSIVLFSGTPADFETDDAIGVFDDDDRGKENIEPEDCFGFEMSIDLTRAACAVGNGCGGVQPPVLAAVECRELTRHKAASPLRTSIPSLSTSRMKLGGFARH